MAQDHITLQKLAQNIRIHATRMIHTAKSSHLGSNLSMAEIMAVLYGKILHISPDEPCCWKRPVNAGPMERRWRYLWKFGKSSSG